MTSRSPELRVHDATIETLDDQQIRALQLRRVRKLLERCIATNPFYREHWRRAGVDVDAIDSLEAFAAIVPTVRKADFVADQEAQPPLGRRAEHAATLPESLFIATTSGTSGQGQEVHVQSARELAATAKVYGYYFRWSGLRPGDRVLLAMPLTMLGGGRLEYHGALAYGLSVLPVGNDDAARKLALGRRFGAAALYGITSYMGRLGHLLGHEGPWPELRALLTGAEGSSVPWLRTLERTWHAPVRDRYGSSQIGADHMFTCEHGVGTPERPGVLHNIDSEVLVEVIDPSTGKHVRDGERGELVITSLYRHDSPIVRCAMGDLAVYREAHSCDCGRPFRGVDVASISRGDDMKKIKGINTWPQAVDSVVFAGREVRDYRLVLSSPCGVERAELRVLPAADLTPQQGDELCNMLTNELEQRIGLRFEVELGDPESFAESDGKIRRWLDQRDHVAS